MVLEKLDHGGGPLRGGKPSDEVQRDVVEMIEIANMGYCFHCKMLHVTVVSSH